MEVITPEGDVARFAGVNQGKRGIVDLALPPRNQAGEVANSRTAPLASAGCSQADRQ